MRVVQNIQMQIGEVDVSKVKFDLKSRDDIPKILMRLQHLYVIPLLRAKLFALLEEHIAPKVDKHNGRPGMTLWRIFVCGVLRLDLNADYDRLHELVNHHDTPPAESSGLSFPIFSGKRSMQDGNPDSVAR